MIAYGVFGKVSSVDPQKTYDYHTAFDIQPTQLVYNVSINMNRKKILNIALDKNINNSAVTVKTICTGEYFQYFMISVMLVFMI